LALRSCGAPPHRGHGRCERCSISGQFVVRYDWHAACPYSIIMQSRERPADCTGDAMQLHPLVRMVLGVVIVGVMLWIADPIAQLGWTFDAYSESLGRLVMCAFLIVLGDGIYRSYPAREFSAAKRLCISTWLGAYAVVVLVCGYFVYVEDYFASAVLGSISGAVFWIARVAWKRSAAETIHVKHDDRPIVNQAAHAEDSARLAAPDPARDYSIKPVPYSEEHLNYLKPRTYVHRKTRHRHEAQEPSVRTKLISIGILLPSCIAIYGLWADFVPSPGWHSFGLVITVGLTIILSMYIYAAHATGKSYVRFRQTRTKYLLRLMGLPLLLALILWVDIVHGLPALITGVVGDHYSTSSILQKERGRRGCRFRIGGQIFDRAFPPHACISRSSYEKLPAQFIAVVHGKRTVLGFYVLSLEHDIERVEFNSRPK
jgi:hypothetical protein